MLIAVNNKQQWKLRNKPETIYIILESIKDNINNTGFD